jgi:hypothetical protein
MIGSTLGMAGDHSWHPSGYESGHTADIRHDRYDTDTDPHVSEPTSKELPPNFQHEWLEKILRGLISLFAFRHLGLS